MPKSDTDPRPSMARVAAIAHAGAGTTAGLRQHLRVLRSRLNDRAEVHVNMTQQQARLLLLKQVKEHGSGGFGRLPAAEAPLIKRKRKPKASLASVPATPPQS